MEDLFGIDDILTDTDTSMGIDESINEAVKEGHERMHTLRNFIIGIIGIAILLFLISVVIKKMNKK